MQKLVKLLLVTLLLGLLLCGSIAAPIGCSTPSASDSIRRAFESRASGIQVSGEGTVVRLLPDDVDGSPHQRFIVEVASGQTLLITHNIDLAPRVENLTVGDNVRFSGEYAWNEQGGVVHWTHRDPHGRHVAGWVEHNGKTYQ